MVILRERGHPVRLSAQRECEFNLRAPFRSLSVLSPLADRMSALQLITNLMRRSLRECCPPTGQSSFGPRLAPNDQRPERNQGP